ncbi:MAG: DNA recombination protein RmuC [Flavobacteriaceae bacterium]
MDIAFWIVGLIVFLALGYFIGMFKAKSDASKENGTLSSLNQLLTTDKELLSTQLKESQSEFNNLKVNLSKKESELDYLTEKLNTQKKDLTDLQEKFTKEFENLANKILDEKSKKFTLQNKENIEGILNPLQEKIQSFEKKVEESNNQNINRSAAFKQQLEELNRNNLRISQETINLTKALKGDSKTQGNWGELILEHVLEKSGLVKDREYFVQQSFINNEDKRVFPDVIINLPDGKKMIVDSKVSLTDYEKYTNSDDKEIKSKFLKEHINSIKRHIKELSDKKYQNLYEIESPDFVLMFIPIESALYIAQNMDNTFFYSAFSKNILLVSPTTLLSTLRTIDALWKNEKQHQNVIEIAMQAGRLYDQFVNLTDDLIKVGNQLKTVQGTYDTSMKKLTGKGNLVTKVENIKKLGVKTNKIINEKLLERASEEE